MSFDRHSLERAIAAHGPVARIVVADVKGSAPREVSASMLVWKGPNGLEQSGTIGGGTLEFEAMKSAFSAPRLQRIPLGPSMGQCCGGAVTLLTEVFETADDIPTDVYARGPNIMPMAVQKALKGVRREGIVSPRLIQDWMIEPVSPLTRPIWLWGAGHVGRAIASVLAPLPQFSVTWIDTHADRFPDVLPARTEQLIATNPAHLVAHAPSDAEHLVLTYSHALDLELCHQILSHPFVFAGLIGSDTKWARFRSRLADLGHTAAQIDRICCPIGQPKLGKHPQAIAVGVAASLISMNEQIETLKTHAGGA
ncbi:xanthine dehydrogenase accessory protein XdhC [Pacificibacter marinus]|uniref:xanthine dehydrogenase accessory protein XdhC n=1 Tax=Pacificibacter marinus TaxID=658057 RepID=UPI001C067B44|nr:xanthine dehydrogenase accessory protein XdhC [Pacificibacter marinus]MBU2865980.1 xanthine dehydrogenase accessory protein XdhC [Pacificibacter marinus]